MREPSSAGGRTAGRGTLRQLSLLLLAAAAGGAMTLLAGGLTPHLDAKAKSKVLSVPCQGSEADDDADRRRAQLTEQNAELRRALLAALARGDCPDPVRAGPELPAKQEDPLGSPEDLEPTSPEEVLARQRAEAASLQGDIDREPVDPVWAPAAERAAALAVTATPSLHLEDVTCRESLCRVRVTHRDITKREDDVEKLLRLTPAGGQARVYSPTDDPTTVMFFSRKGTMLSIFAPPVPLVAPPPLPPLPSGGG